MNPGRWMVKLTGQREMVGGLGSEDVVASERFTGPWLSLPSDRLAEELADAGFALTTAGPSWGLVRKDAR